MWPFRSRRTYTFRREAEVCQLETEDIQEGLSFWERLFLGDRKPPRALIARGLAARDRQLKAKSPDEDHFFLVNRSWRRFGWALAFFAIVWLVGYFA